MNRVLDQLKFLLADRISWTLVSLNGFLLSLGLWMKDWDFRHFHFYYEPIPIQIFTLINFPALLIAEFTERLMFGVSGQAASYVRISEFQALSICFFSILQWLIVGRVLSFLFSRTSNLNS